MTIKLDKYQQHALDRFIKWYEDPDKPQIFRLFGYAGVGKTSLAIHIAQIVDGTVMFVAFTGKASLVANQKLMAAGLPPYVTTIHQLIYIPVIKNGTLRGFKLNQASAIRNADLLIIDEVSMVSRKIALDLESFGVPIFVIGDPAQLPPPLGMEHYIGQKPDVLLEHIHRQAHGNPILKIADRVHGNHGTVQILRHHDVTPRS
jgi:exodeoxyribonuclease-5